MDDAQAVSLRDGLACLEDELDRLLYGKWASLMEPRSEIPAVEVLHHHVRSAVGECADVGDSCDVLALDLHRRPRLTSETTYGLGIAKCVRQEELERDLLVELDVMRGDDDAHATDSEDALDAVLPGEHVAFAYTCRRV
jgi:hypothetical protein